MSQQSTSNPMILDCTFRDGGYYNEWDFATELVQEYIDSVHASGITLIELGFRQMPADRYLGPLAYTTDEYLSTLSIPDGITLGVMVDAKHVLASARPTERIRKLFCPSADSKVKLVRIAAHYAEVEHLGPVIASLHSLGYRVGLNLMQSSSRTHMEISRFGELAAGFGVEVAYFADSFGGMQAQDVRAFIDSLKTTWRGPIGCHMHDNMTLALANTLAAIESGATWVDGTVLGMGRGPGNARSEYLAIEFMRRGIGFYDHLPLTKLVQGSFSELHGRYGWGTNPYYFLSAARGIHPTYIQELTSDGRYGIKEVVTALESLRDGLGASFSRASLTSAVAPAEAERVTGTYDVSGWCEGRDVLVVGPGPAGQERKADVEGYIKRTQPLVMALNVRPPIDSELVDALVVCHPVRVLMDAKEIAKTRVPVFAPQEVASRANGEWEQVDVRDFGLRLADTSSYTSTGCTLTHLEAIAYALAIAGAGGARRVLLSGFDGFGLGDPRQEAMASIFSQFRQIEGAPPVVSVTRTSYSIEQSSIFAPAISRDDE